MSLMSDAIEAADKALRKKLQPVLLDTLNEAGAATAERFKSMRAAWYDEKTGIDTHGREPGPNKDKVATAKANYKAANAAEQRHAEGNENTARSMIGGKQYKPKEVERDVKGRNIGQNGKLDVKQEISGKVHGFEVKTIVDGKQDKIRVDGKQKAGKEKWAAKHGATLHTVVFDDRKIWGGKNSNRYSGHRVYYRRGVGAFRLKGMTKVKSSSHLRQLIHSKEAE